MIKKLLYLNGLATLAVVLNHARVWGIIGMFHWTDRYRPVSVPNYDQVGSIAYYTLLLVAGIIQFGVPTFLFVSGFYIAIATGRIKSTIPWNNVFNRIKFLVIPYVVWFVIMAGVLLIVDGERYTPGGYVRLLLTGYIQGPYYYVPMLVQLYLLSPLIVPLAKSNWKLLLVISGLIQMLTQILLYFEMFQISTPFQEYHTLPIWFSLTRMFWFIFGIIVGLHIQTFKSFFERGRWIFLILAFVFLLISIYERNLIFIEDITIPVETIIGSLYTLCFIFVMIGFSNIQLPLPGKVEQIGINSFGIYLTHSAAQQYSSKIIYHIAPWLLGYPLLFTVVIFFIGLGVPGMLMVLVRRSPLSRYYQYIFG